jgi:hypothetical protein
MAQSGRPKPATQVPEVLPGDVALHCACVTDKQAIAGQICEHFCLSICLSVLRYAWVSGESSRFTGAWQLHVVATLPVHCCAFRAKLQLRAAANC